MSKPLIYVVGTRPEIIRSAKIISHLDNGLHNNSILVNTGQHYDPILMKNFFSELHVREANYNLEQNYANGTNQIAGIISAMAEVIRSTECAAVAVYGDTNSSLAAAIAAVKEKVPLVHIEAGCRSFDIRMQEEHNRRMIDHVSNLCLSVSDVSTSHLIDEHVPGIISTIGDPQFDIFAEVYSSIQKTTHHNESNNATNPTGLLTIHRAENVDDPTRILKILNALSRASDGRNFDWIFPIHPRTSKQLANKPFPHIRFVEPLGYRTLLETLKAASLCITDSGGLQKEAFWAGTPCITMRRSTEWIETVTLGRNLLIDDPDLLAPIVNGDIQSYFRGAPHINPYGPIGASQRTATRIFEWLDSGE